MKWICALTDQITKKECGEVFPSYSELSNHADTSIKHFTIRQKKAHSAATNKLSSQAKSSSLSRMGGKT